MIHAVVVSSQVFTVAADQALANSTTPIDITDLAMPIGPNVKFGIKAWIPFNLGAASGGFRFQLGGSISPNNILVSGVVYNCVSSTLAKAGLITSFGSPFAGALAAAGTHIAMFEGLIDNGANAGFLTIQFAQNASNASPITIKAGAALEVWGQG
jgi:hypothetical protein